MSGPAAAGGSVGADGGIPYDAILEKMEETDPDAIAALRGGPGGAGDAPDYDDYDGYVRAEIVDWGPDAPWLESDRTRRDPAISRSALNLRYNGTRGSRPELPRHPELFYGFTDPDPRGAGTEPRLDQAAGQLACRAERLAVAMGNNDDAHVAERPWTGQAISYGMKEVHRRLKENTRVFSAQRTGMAPSRRDAADPAAAGRARAAQKAGESLAEAGQPRFAGGDHAPAAGADDGGVRGVRGEVGDPWRHAVGDADLGVERFAPARGGGGAPAADRRVGAARADHDWAESRTRLRESRHVLAATMAQAVRTRSAARAHRPDAAPGASLEASGPGGAGLVPGADVGAAYRAVVGEARRPAGEVQDGEAGRSGGRLAPGRDPGRAARGTRAHAAATAHLADAAAIATGLREGSAAARRRVAGLAVAAGSRHLAGAEGVAGARGGLTPGADYGAVAGLAVADGSRHLAGAEGEGGARGGLLPGADYGGVARAGEAALLRAAGAGLEVHVYGSGGPGRPERRVAAGREAFDRGTWRGSSVTAGLGKSKAAGEWRSATQGHTTLGAGRAETFGPDVAVGSSGVPVGPKSLRASGWNAPDGVGEGVGGLDI